MKNIVIKNVGFGNENFSIIAGPCVIENRDHALMMAESIQKITSEIGIGLIYKSSFDKANRSSIRSFRGLGVDEGLRILSDIKSITGLSVITDIHESDQADPVSQIADILQIPAYLCRQTDLLVGAAKTGRIINVKKGQFLAPWDMKNVVEKLESSGCENILITDRGTQFGYNNLVADMRSIPIMQKFGYPIIFDATHSAQLPGGNGVSTAGMRDMIPTLARSAVAAGCNGLFMEVHNDVENAKSDSSTQWPLDNLRDLLISIKAVRESLS
tara:strand:- start:22 stop:834 length:813 start_codon:yes stop_codon:yes gene_type:complete